MTDSQWRNRILKDYRPELADLFQINTKRPAGVIAQCKCPDDLVLRIVWQAAVDLTEHGVAHFQFVKLKSSGNTVWQYLTGQSILPPTSLQAVLLEEHNRKQTK